MTNKRIRVAMVQAGLNQKDLAKLIKVPNTELSIMLKYELAVRVQNDIVARIREHEALQKGQVS